MKSIISLPFHGSLVLERWKWLSDVCRRNTPQLSVANPGKVKPVVKTDLQSLTSDSQAVRGVVLAPAAAGAQMQSDFPSQAEVSIDVVMRK
ncbi:MAG: hypothetical protein RSE32_07745 [Comamonas sp.]|uniref:hypothetical protein n=1 Tax=Comamonas sp. TaxID=34028 RepID=UPI002FC8044F